MDVISFLITTISAIVLGVAANILTPKFQDWWSKTSVSRAQQGINRWKNRMSHTLALKDDKGKFDYYLRKSFIRSALYGVIGLTCMSNSIFTKVSSQISNSVIPKTTEASANDPFGSIIVMLFFVGGSILMGCSIGLLLNLDTTNNNVRFYDTYKITIEKEIAKLENVIRRSSGQMPNTVSPSPPTKPLSD